MSLPDDEARDLIAGHLQVVVDYGDKDREGLDEWPPDAPKDIAAFGAWCFVEGYAAALNVTVTQLLDDMDLTLAPFKG